MRQLVIQQAEGRLKLAERAFAALIAAGIDEAEFQTHWLDFLVQWKGTYTKIQQAAKDSPKELQWFGGVNTARRADPLLRWLFEARNDGEHGTDRSARHKGKGFKFTSSSTSLSMLAGPGGAVFRQDGTPIIIDDGGREIEGVSVAPAESTLLEVTEFDGKRKVPPPTSHLGNPMEPKPHLAAELGLKWLRGLVATAKAMKGP